MTDYEKLKGIIDEIDMLISHRVTSDAPEFIAWKNLAERFLLSKYGKDSLEYKDFKETSFSLSFWTFNTPDSAFADACKSSLVSTKLIFQNYLKEIEDEATQLKVIKSNHKFDKVFIVHGHDGELKFAVARLVEKQGLNAIILSEQANKGKTIIEKFEENRDASGAICLFTADDLGHSNSDIGEKARARQNVVFETGYFMGKLGREKIVIIAENGL